VDAPFGRGEHREDRERAVANHRLERAGGEEVADLAIRSMHVPAGTMVRARIVWMLAVHADVELRCGDPGSLDPFGRDGDAVEVETCDGIPHGVERHTGVEQRADGHVAADAGKCIEKSYSHDVLSIAALGAGW
jgi:hypothetical protein